MVLNTLAAKRFLNKALEVGDYTTGDTHDVSRCRTEVVVPRSRRCPHFVVLQQVRVDEDAQLCAVTKGRHAAFGLVNLLNDGGS